MSLLADLAFVFVAGLVTCLATGLGALPFFLVDDISDRWKVALWGIAGGIMLSASFFGLLNEGLAESTGGLPALLAIGVVTGVLLVVVSDWFLDRIDVSKYTSSDHHDHAEAQTDGGHGHGHEDGHGHDHEDGHGHDHHIDPEAIAHGNMKTLILILGILTVHSFPEGIAVGVSFADMGLDGGVPIYGFAIPVLAIMMTISISIHNIPEGLAISIPLKNLGMSKWRMVGAAVFSSLPQPIGAVVAFYFVSAARAFLPFGFGFAAGAMIYLVITEFVPEALEAGEDLPSGGLREFTAGGFAGFAVMVPLLFL